MPDEYRRAVLMRLCRDEAMGQLNQAIAVVLSVTEYRAMTAAELPGALRAAEATIADMKRQKQEQEQ